MGFVLTTDTVSTKDRVSFWSKAVTQTIGSQNVTLRNKERFEGWIRVRDLGYLRVVAVGAEAMRLSRHQDEAVRFKGEFVSVALQERGRCVFTQGGRTARLGQGEMVVYLPSRPFTLEQFECFRMYVFQLPLNVVAVSEGRVHGVAGMALSCGSGVASVLAPLLTGLADEDLSCPLRVGEQLAGNVADLVATLVTERAEGEQRPAELSGREALASRLHGFINSRLSDPDLCPEIIARENHISVRYLHKIFEGEDTTVQRFIQQRRLEECSRELQRRGRVSSTVSAVAQRWGFVNPAHFSRVFRAAYGVSPRDWRDSTVRGRS